MNWDAIGTIGEIAGAIAVIISLLYLATEIRAGNKSTRYAAGQSCLDMTTQFLGRISSDSDLSTLWYKALRSNKSLTQDEWDRFGLLCLEITYIWERVYHLKQNQDIDAHLVEGAENSRRSISVAPGYLHWFQKRKGNYSSEFVKIMEIDIEKSRSYKTTSMPTSNENYE